MTRPDALSILATLATQVAHDASTLHDWTADDIRTMTAEDRALRETVRRARYAVSEQNDRRTTENRKQP